MGNKCCRSDGHVALDSIANEKHASLVDGQATPQAAGKKVASESIEISSVEASKVSDIAAVETWRQRSLERSDSKKVLEEFIENETFLIEIPTPQAAPFFGSLNMQEDSRGLKPSLSRDDTLPDLDSDIDSITKDQYLTACRILHKTMIQKQDRLTETEREFLENLLNDGSDRDSCVSMDQLAVIESATKALANDPLFIGSPIKANSGSVFLNRDKQDDHAIPNDLETRNRSLESLEILRELKEDEASLFPTSPHRKSVLSEGKFGDYNNVEVSLPRDASLVSDDSIFRSEYESGEDMPSIDLAPSIKRLKSAHGYTNSKANDPPGPYKHMASLLRTEPALVEEFDEDDTPFNILGAPKSSRRILTPTLMEALRGFLPYVVSEENFWLKFTLENDGDSLVNLLHSIRGSKYTFFAIRSGSKIFGSFTGSKWRKQDGWFGTGEAFLWRVMDSLKVYPYTGTDVNVQYCTSRMIAIGGGDWGSGESPYNKSTQSQGIGLLIDADLLGGESNSCATFCNPTLSGEVQEFNITDLEVWTMTPCHNVFEAEKLELHKLFVEEHRRN